jgi:hypothetical protein
MQFLKIYLITYRLLGCFLLGLCLPCENLSPVLRGSDNGGFDVVSFWGRRFGTHVDLLLLWMVA